MTWYLVFDFLVELVEGGQRHGVVLVVHHLAFEGLWHFSVEVHFFGFLVEHGVVHWVVHDFLFLEGKEFLLLGEKVAVVHGWGDHLFSFEVFLQQHLLQEHILAETLGVEHGWVQEFLLTIDLEHTGRSVAAEDFGVVVFGDWESQFVEEHLLKEFILDKVVLDEGILVEGILDEVILVEGILDEVVLVKGILDQILLDFILDQVLLKFILDELFLDFFLDDFVNWENWNADDFSINNLDFVVDFWLSGDVLSEELSVNILGHEFGDFRNWDLVEEEISVDLLDQVLVVDIVDIESLLSVEWGGGLVFWDEGKNFTVNESVLVQSLDSTEVIEEVDVGGGVDGANEFAVDSTDFGLDLQSLDLRVDVLVEEDWVSEVLLELWGGEEESLEEGRSNILLEDVVLHVLSEQRNAHVFSKQFSVVQFSDGVDGGKVSSQTLHWKVNTLDVDISDGGKSTDSSDLSIVFLVQQSLLLLQLDQLIFVEQVQRTSSHRGDEESDSDESLHVERASLVSYPK
jgi:hypothetical protein